MAEVYNSSIMLRIFFVVLLCGLAGYAQAPVPTKSEPAYEMTTYVVGFLSRGPNWTPDDTEETRKLQEGHMANIRRMADEEKLVVAGPFRDGGDLRGMFIFSGVSLEEAKRMVDRDPAVQAGRLELKLYTWMAAKGIRIDPPR